MALCHLKPRWWRGLVLSVGGGEGGGHTQDAGRQQPARQTGCRVFSQGQSHQNLNSFASPGPEKTRMGGSATGAGGGAATITGATGAGAGFAIRSGSTSSANVAS